MRKEGSGATEAAAASPSQIWLCCRIGRGAVRNTECLRERETNRERKRPTKRDREGKYFYICTHFIKI